MKKILFILSTELSYYQMLTYLLENEKKYELDILIQNNQTKLYRYKDNKKFKSKSGKSFFIKQPPNPKFFSILKFWNIFYANKNNLIKKKINYLLKKKSFNLRNYDEVYFSNESISHYLLYNSKIKKIYFDHSPIDTMLNINLNFIKKYKNYIEYFVNNKFMNIYFKGNNNFQQKSIFANFLKKKNSKYQLSIKVFRNIFYRFNKENVNIHSRNVYNLINFYMPFYAFDVKSSKKMLTSYINFFIEKILKKIFLVSGTNDIFLLKFRQNIPIEFQIEVMKIVRNKFSNKKFVHINKQFPKMTNLEKIVTNFNLKRYFTSPSSSIFLTKVLNPKIIIYDYGLEWSTFLKQNWNFFKHKNNFNNYKTASKMYRSVAAKL